MRIKRLLLGAMMCIVLQAQAQTFECPKVFEDAKVWNSVKGSDTALTLSPGISMSAMPLVQI